MFKKKNKNHNIIIKELEKKRKLAEMKCEERKLKIEIIKLYLPFQFKVKFNKAIVCLSIVAIIIYTVAAILLQKYTMTELSPTLTTCVYAFFGTELLGLAGIKIFDTKCGIQSSNDCVDINTSNTEDMDDVIDCNQIE